MPAPVSTSILILGAILTAVSGIAGAAVAFVAVIFEMVLAWNASDSQV